MSRRPPKRSQKTHPRKARPISQPKNSRRHKSKSQKSIVDAVRKWLDVKRGDDRREDGEGTSSAGGTPSWTTLTPAAFKQILMELHESLDDNRGGMCSHVVEELTNCVVFGKLLT